MSNEISDKRTLTIRVGKNTLSFSMIDVTNTEQPIIYEPYVVKSGVSMAANIREAFKHIGIRHADVQRVRVLVDSKVLMMPVEQFQEGDIETLYRHSFPGSEQDAVVYNVLPDLNAVAVFAINKDLRMVIGDHFDDVRIIHVMAPVWRYLHQRSFAGHRNKLYGYFHDKQLDIFSFQQNRFKFCNSFDTSLAHDSLYFLLYVWKQLNLQPEHDEMHIVGEIPEREWLQQELRKYLQKAYVINPTAEFNRAPATQLKNMPFDLMTLFTKGR
ncbi:MAG: DUF3822 family protein [Prevotella sp.]|nr:DUF3822 family protein [Prevotella sp.]